VYKKESIWEKWLSRLPWLNLGASPTNEQLDEEARHVIRQEIRELDNRRERIVKLLDEPERLRNKKIAIKLAEDMQANLREKRRNQPQLTLEEQIAKQEWTKNLTPRAECRHLKGAEASRWGVDRWGGNKFGTAKDYNLACHTFPDAKTKIWCLNGCGFTSSPSDPNWKQAVEMFRQSSNSKSSSEIVPIAIPSRGEAV